MLQFFLCRLCRPPTTSQTDNTTALLILFHPGFLILDSIHFQYNAFLFGIMIWSLVGAKEVRWSAVTVYRFVADGDSALG